MSAFERPSGPEAGGGASVPGWADAVRRLYALERRGIKLDLDRVRACLEALGRPQDACPSLLVAGTNGKGSTAAALASTLALAGRRVGLYTSPHLLDLRERIRVDGRMAAPERLLPRLEQDWEVWERHQLTFFEATTLLAFAHFRDAGVDLAVLEVGMGGRLDATNTVEPILSVVTSLGMDHANALGATAAAIAREKAGILRPGIPAVLDGGVLGGPSAVAARAEEIGAPLFRRRDCLRASAVKTHDPLAGGWGDDPVGPALLRFRLHRREGAPRGFALRPEGLALRTRLAGRHQASNLSLAALALLLLREQGFAVDEPRIEEGLARVRWPGRLDRPLPGVRLLADVAHNREGASAVARHLAPFVARGGRLLPVVSLLAQKDHAGFFRHLRRIAGEVRLAPLDSDRAAPLSALAAAAGQAGLRVRTFESVAAALEEALAEAETSEGAWVLLSGSFHTLDEGYRRLGVAPAESLWDPAG